jgi:ABC-type Na+ efflux pump permease subunit
MEDHDLLDSGFIDQEERELLSLNNFIILFFLTTGIYGIWWMYKTWRFFKEKDNLDIMPAMRAIFAIFFLFGLLERILTFAHSKGYEKNYSSSGLFIGFILFNFLAQLPDPMWVISLLSFIFLIPPFKAFNYALMQSEDVRFYEREGFNQRQIVLVVLGAFLWFLIIIGLLYGE